MINGTKEGRRRAFGERAARAGRRGRRRLQHRAATILILAASTTNIDLASLSLSPRPALLGPSHARFPHALSPHSSLAHSWVLVVSPEALLYSLNHAVSHEWRFLPHEGHNPRIILCFSPSLKFALSSPAPPRVTDPHLFPHLFIPFYFPFCFFPDIVTNLFFFLDNVTNSVSSFPDVSFFLLHGLSRP